MPAKYKLTYFNARGLAEIPRLLFAQAGVDYEDVRIEKDKWPELKPAMPFGKVPVLEVDGNVISESRAIARYIARQHGLVGKDDFEAARCDMLIDAFYDTYQELRPWFLETDEAKKTELLNKFMTETLPPALENFQKILDKNNGGSGYFVGTELTWADIGLAHTLYNLKGLNPKILENHKLLEDFLERIINLPNIKAWIEKRPVTEF